MELFHYTPGRTPLLIDVPHAGTHIPDEIATRLTDIALTTPDTDWFQDRLYGFALDMGAGMLAATHSRYVVDLNRSPDDVSLYPGQDAEGILPLKTSEGRPVYRKGEGPTEAEKPARIATYHAPYHQKLQSALDDIRTEHGYALLWDAHSIKSRLPRFFDGQLWDLNLGTNMGATCDPDLRDDLDAIAKASPYSHAMDGRFLGGYITRHYGRPENGVHAVQLELSRVTYMDDDAPFAYDTALADNLVPTLRLFLERMLAFKPA